MIKQTHKVQPNPNPYFYVFDITSEPDFFFINDVAATWTKLQLVAILPLLSFYIVINELN